ncbi:hypothetical protein ACFB49_20710 [Sphingomonas sp. DBB INV C78]|uniref:hypothetical protein n=1 Tax=Sphingomonas sp. DBB INV C78 TaxID=3349434 RepID=UPI0036D3275C
MTSVRDSAERAGTYASEKLNEAKTQLRERTEATRVAASEALQTARGKAAEAKSATAEGIENNPVTALVAGIAVGAVIGALLPRSEREKAALAPIGGKLNEAAHTAIAAAKAAGQEKLDELGINKDAASKQVSKLMQAVTKTAGAAGTAAVGTVKTR